MIFKLATPEHQRTAKRSVVKAFLYPLFRPPFNISVE